MNSHDIGFSQAAEKARIEAYQKLQREAGEQGAINKFILTILLLLCMGSPWIVLYLISGGLK